MKSNKARHSRQYFRYNKAKLGAKPGSIIIPIDALASRVYLYTYNEEHFSETASLSVEEARNHAKPKTDQLRWIDIRGLADPQLYSWLAEDFGIHPLELEDISSRQQPKADAHFGHLFMVARMLYFDNQQQLINEQLSFFVLDNTLITIQETYEDVLDPVRNRLRNEKMPIRKRKSEYLAYALLDAVFDHYFLLLHELGMQLETLEDSLVQSPRRQHRNDIMQLKHELLNLRRIIWPSREMVNNILRNNYLIRQDDISIYLRDLYDHIVTLMDLTEIYREVSGNLLDLYNSSVSNNMNEIMKILTMISAIFIPLSFVAGIYGMNFVSESADGKSMSWNMPELYQPYGYVVVLGMMLLIALLQLMLFWRKGWFKKW
ncbi:MAG: magnesium/cobalt transporter CorA [Bacteroidia bacterium]